MTRRRTIALLELVGWLTCWTGWTRLDLLALLDLVGLPRLEPEEGQP